ncbi:hypothetical protein EDC04DRAFT_2607488 [Pisolithus marmoratus]|nr:hypothetical protein EDC04DRAFT_2607488 [Pisolithus marmoratus]
MKQFAVFVGSASKVTMTQSPTNPDTLHTLDKDEPVNPMAPGHSEDEQESQILPWAVELIPPLAEQSPGVWPSFKCPQPSQPFGFKLPSQASTGLIVPINNETTGMVPNWLYPNSCCNFACLQQLKHPSTIAKSHTIFAENTDGGLDADEDGLVIDEVSPSEDDHYVEAVVCSETRDHGHSSQLSEKYSQSSALMFQGDHGSTNMQQRSFSGSVEAWGCWELGGQCLQTLPVPVSAGFGITFHITGRKADTPVELLNLTTRYFTKCLFGANSACMGWLFTYNPLSLHESPPHETLANQMSTPTWTRSGMSG